jgi:MoaD family protein
MSSFNLIPCFAESRDLSCMVKTLMRNSLISHFFSSLAHGALTLQVSVRFFTSLREIIGKKEETLTFPQDEKVTIQAALETLKQRYGKQFVEYVYDHETREVKGFLQFLVNGKSASTMNGLETPLADGDILAILPPVGGG